MDGSSEAEDPKDFALAHTYGEWERTRGRRRAGGVCQEFRDRAQVSLGGEPGYQSPRVCLRAQSGPTFCDPMDSSLPGSSVRRILQARVLERLAISSFRRSCESRGQTHISCISCRQILYHWTTWKALLCYGSLAKSSVNSLSLWEWRSQHLYRSCHCPQHTPFHRVSLIVITCHWHMTSPWS